MIAGGGGIWDAFTSQMCSRGAMVIILATSLSLALQTSVDEEKGGGGGAHGVSLVGGAWLASSAALSVLVFL